jgi:hypothetical protein
MQDAPDPTFSTHVSREFPQKGCGVEAIRLGLSSPAIDINARRINDQAGHAETLERPVQPESISSRFVAAHHWGIDSESEAALRSSDFSAQPREIARGHCAHSRRLRRTAGTETELPFGVAEIKCEE